MAKRLEDLPIYSKATAFHVAVVAILERPAWGKYPGLRDQIADANDSITANMHEGFEQASDREFARFLRYAKGSAAEVVARLGQGHVKNCISKEEHETLSEAGEALARMLGGFINYFVGCNWTDRGTFKAKRQAAKTARGEKPR